MGEREKKLVVMWLWVVNNREIKEDVGKWFLVYVIVISNFKRK